MVGEPIPMQLAGTSPSAPKPTHFLQSDRLQCISACGTPAALINQRFKQQIILLFLKFSLHFNTEDTGSVTRKKLVANRQAPCIY